MNYLALNADLGEGYEYDAALMPLIDAASIACGGHAGGVDSMREAVQLARANGVRIGAHPSYPDREHFGRVSLQMSDPKLVASLTAQLWALKAVCIEAGVSVSYVKPHGALYNDAARDPKLAALLAQSVYEIDPSLALMAMTGSELVKAGEAVGLTVIREAFADRAYLDDGSLAPRSEAGAVLDDIAAIAQVESLWRQGGVYAQNGDWLPLVADSVCIHGDNAHALKFAQTLRKRFPRRV
ncbi:5-oxoprolinase subunit PxpA [Jeongeupia naejangsanensis]|uniref:5-oxoprolinase subunit PxpA n=1 Tax=Jeongeupia naejangsanensis TaxID=613195 RepID=A0ABS2BM82_9NEIS|nr:5-oxoprolinase subunit PxpA [Jeongeupia naejangsanensis]MBM3116724.1 5-oxoprolinase subunit PxpA [Jeongeupia naejangsanensis]